MNSKPLHKRTQAIFDQNYRTHQNEKNELNKTEKAEYGPHKEYQKYIYRMSNGKMKSLFYRYEVIKKNIHIHI